MVSLGCFWGSERVREVVLLLLPSRPRGISKKEKGAQFGLVSCDQKRGPFKLVKPSC